MTEATLYTAAVKNKQMKYKVISILQPWASLVVLGHKKIETRSWNTKYRGPLLIHASAKFTKEQERLAHEFFQLTKDSRVYHCQRGAIIGQVNMVETFTSEEAKNRIAYLDHFGNLKKDQELAFGDYSPNRYGWLLSDPKAFPVIIPAKGQLGIWEYDMPEKIGYNLPSGGHASFEGMPDQKTVEAVEAMVEKAKQLKFPV